MINGVILDTPYGQARFDEATKEAWDVMSLFRALRAYHRGSNDLPLSQRKGITCSQFITYCYQAASISKKLGGAPIPNDWLQHMSETGAIYKPKKSSVQADLIKQGLSGVSGGFISKAMKIDAKTTSAANLYEHLAMDESDFEFIGYVHNTTDKGPLHIVSDKEEAQQLERLIAQPDGTKPLDQRFRSRSLGSPTASPQKPPNRGMLTTP